LHAALHRAEWRPCNPAHPFESVPTEPIYADMEDLMTDTMDRSLRIMPMRAPRCFGSAAMVSLVSAATRLALTKE